MSHPEAGSRGAMQRSRPWIRRFHPVLPAFALLGAALTTTAASAQVRVTPVQFWAAGHVIPLTPSAVWTGRETYVPLTALRAIGARASLPATRDGIAVRMHNGRVDDLPYARIRGVTMISLTDVAISSNARVLPPRPNPAPGLRPDTAYLLANITDVHVRGGSLHITTSFPVPFAASGLGGGTARGYIDCIGATYSGNFKPTLIPAAERRADRIRMGHFAPEITRVALDLAPGYTLEHISTEGRVTPTFAAALTSARGRDFVGVGPLHTRTHPGTVRRERIEDPSTGYETFPPTRAPRQPGRNDAPVNPDDPYSDSGSGSTIPPTEVRPGRRLPLPTENRPGRRVPPQTDDRPDRRITPPVTASSRVADIRSIVCETPDAQTVQIVIETNRKLKPYVRNAAASRQVIVDIPNSRLNLDDDRQKDQSVRHALVEGFTAATVQSSTRIPPLTRITIDTSRSVTTTFESDSGQIIIEITAPRTTRLNRAIRSAGHRSVVVVDAGHGGALTGATAYAGHRSVYEKDITLAIARRLRSALVARGNSVVMTRVGDKNVPLQDRPRLANEIGANVFISLHNDSWGKANAITGTTTYFHGDSVESHKLARCVERQLAAVSGMRDRGAVSDSTMYPIGFCVLRDTAMPAVLCELGYLNNIRDRSKLVNAGYQQRVAEAVCNGILDYVAGVQSTARHRARKPVVSA